MGQSLVGRLERQRSATDLLPRAGAIIMPWKTEDTRDRRMQVSSLRYYWSLAHTDPTAGVQVSPNIAEDAAQGLNSAQTVRAEEYWDEAEYDHSGEWYETVFPNFRRLRKHELPPGTSAGSAFTALSVNPEPYLHWIRGSLETKGVRFIRQELLSLEDAAKVVRCGIIVNASGLGAASLAADRDVIGIKGQTMLVSCPVDPKERSRTLDREVRIRRGTEYTYVLPRMLSGSVVIGGIEDENSTNAEISTALKEDILRRVNLMTGGWFKDVKPGMVQRDIVGIRPGRRGGYRIEREGTVVHAYGFGGAGYRYSVGAAEEVLNFVREGFLSEHKL